MRKRRNDKVSKVDGGTELFDRKVRKMLKSNRDEDQNMVIDE